MHNGTNKISNTWKHITHINTFTKHICQIRASLHFEVRVSLPVFSCLNTRSSPLYVSYKLHPPLQHVLEIFEHESRVLPSIFASVLPPPNEINSSKFCASSGDPLSVTGRWRTGVAEGLNGGAPEISLKGRR